LKNRQKLAVGKKNFGIAKISDQQKNKSAKISSLPSGQNRKKTV